MKPRLLVLSLVALVLAAACSHAPTTKSTAINIFIVPDLSGSAYGTSKDHGEVVVQKALDKAARTRGSVTVVALTNDTAGQTNIGMEADFAKPPAWVEPTNEQSVAIWTANLLDSYRKWRAKQPVASASDYLGMLLVASRLIASSTDAQNEVWIVGDGIQNSGRWSMYRRHPTGAMCKTKAKAMKHDGTLGDLRGAAVYFIGGGLNRVAVFTPAEQAQLTACWAEIVHIAGGQTPVDWWNPTRLMAPATS
jgi:hypothetical protein